jgi:peptide/nickel transport system substrate-binding protein
MNIYLSEGFVHYSNPAQKSPATPWEARIDELMKANQRTVDVAQRKERFKEVLRLWSENLPEIDLVAANYFVAAKNRFGNFRPSALPYYTYWNIDELYLTK